MKRIRRPKVKIPILQSTGRGGMEASRLENLFKLNQNLAEVTSKFYDDYWGNADVRGALWAMHGRSCAYCDRNLPGTDRGDVEHFRPKSIYWWLAYSFDNYLLACTACNSSYKGNKFPLLPRKNAYSYTMKDKLGRESRALIDPVADPVEGWFGIEFEGDVSAESFKLKINPGIGRMAAKRCEQTREFFRLNLDSELMEERQVAVHYALNLVSKAIDGDEASRKELRKRAVRFSPHSFAVREVILSYSKSPQYLPTPEEEVEWLLDELTRMLRRSLDSLSQQQTTTEEIRRD